MIKVQSRYDYSLSLVPGRNDNSLWLSVGWFLSMRPVLDLSSQLGIELKGAR